MPEKLITKIRTSAGDLPIDYNALANLPDLGQVASLDEIGKANLSKEVQEALDKTDNIEQVQTTANEAKQGVAELEDYIDNLDKNKSSSIDLSAFESTGTIVETFADGSTKTTTMEFDANGNPIKITDTNGNVTILTW